MNARNRQVVLLEQQPAVDRILQVRRVVPFAQDRGELVEVIAAHEDQAREFHTDVDDHRHFLRLEIVVEPHGVHE